MLRRTLRERKRVGIDVDRYDPLLADGLYAFQAPEVLAAVARVTGLSRLTADPSLYASGLSVMAAGDFLHPHLDNSHDGDRARYRVLNLLYYVTPGWRREDGGHLELWDADVRTPTVIESRSNRLAVIETHRASWHSVARVVGAGERRCLSNYYFSPDPPGGRPYRHVTTFTGRPEEPVARALLDADGVARNLLGRALPFLTRMTRHRRQPGA
jgi:Rps23 Pro-64 3,4-dihydroxylase Tpa1-like proline 4-hydroxylase